MEEAVDGKDLINAMPETPDFDLNKAHKYFSAACFNACWELINKEERTPEEDEQMLRLSMASAWHWTQRGDCTPTNMAIAFWQLARVYALLYQVENARHYGHLSMEASRQEGVEPVFEGFANEALARAEMVAGERAQMYIYLDEARRIADLVTDEEDKQQLLADLETIR